MTFTQSTEACNGAHRTCGKGVWKHNLTLRAEVKIELSVFFVFGPYSQFLDDNDDGESQKFLSNGIMKKKKYEEYHDEYVSVNENVVGFWCTGATLTPHRAKIQG